MSGRDTKVGFVGVGTIGKPMALNIVKGGYALTVFDLHQAAVAELIAAGAKGAATPAEVARQSDVVITMVPDAPDVEKAALGPGGIIEGLRPGPRAEHQHARLGAEHRLRRAGDRLDLAWLEPHADILGIPPVPRQDRPAIDRRRPTGAPPA
jgi:hypothetical protein